MELDQVPCDGCRLCCQNWQGVVVDPEIEDVSKYMTVPLKSDPSKRIIRRKENGDCIYLEPHGCGIYEERPNICKQFDCRDITALTNPLRPYVGKDLAFTRGEELIQKSGKKRHIFWMRMLLKQGGAAADDLREAAESLRTGVGG